MNPSDRALPSENPGSSLRGDWFRLLVAAVIVGAVYAWALTTNPSLPMVEARGWAYYPLMAEGWLHGRLDLPRAVPAGLLALPDPYDPKANSHYRLEDNLHDLSLYRGKLYLYFGPAPALVAFLPWRLLTGHALSTPWAVAGFCWMGFLAGGCLLLRMRRRYFPQAGAGAVLAGLLVIGLCNWTPVLLRRANVWEVPVAGAYFFLSASLLCLHESLHAPRRVPWLVAAGLAYGFAIGARPDCAFGALVLLIPLWWGLRGKPRAWAGGGFWIETLAVLGPLVVLVAGLLWFNHRRFGNPFEFGQSYQLAGNREGNLRHFSWDYVPFNGWLYWLAAPQMNAYFPFLRPPVVSDLPAGQFGVQDVYGLLRVLPVLWLAPLALGSGACSEPARRGTVAMMAIVAGSWGALLMAYGGATSRYEMELAALTALLAAVGILTCEKGLAGRVRWRRLVRAGWTGLLGLSLAATFFVSIQEKQIFRLDHPGAYRRLAHAFDRPAAWFERRRGGAFGPLRLTLRFPAGKADRTELLVCTGSLPYLDGVVIQYVDTTHLRLGFVHGLEVSLSALLPLDFRIPHLLRVSFGSLYPPREHPFFDAFSAGRAEELATTVKIELDGRVVLQGQSPCFDALTSRPFIGVPVPGLPRLRFSGEIISVDRPTGR